MKIFEFLKKFLIFYKFKKHNEKIFNTKDLVTKKKILVEFNNFACNHVPLSYCSNILKKKYNANIVAYYGHVLLSYPFEMDLKIKLKFIIGRIFGLNFYGVYKSFGANKFFFPRLSDTLEKKANRAFVIFSNKVKDLRDIENFKINNVLIGDLLYDTYLKSNYDLNPTIEINSRKFQLFVKDFISLYFAWEDYIKKNNVKAIISSHSVYSMGIPLRIGVKKNIDSFVLTPENLFRLKKNFFHQYYEVNYFKKIFSKIKKNKKNKIKKLALKKINLRLSGKYTGDYPYITKSPFGLGNKNFKLRNTGMHKFLIATHDFVDAPHAMGNSLFPDFFTWFNFLCELSTKTNDTWMVKTHPDFGGEYSKYIQYERKVAKGVCSKYKNIHLLPSNITHNDIAKLKIDAVFTVNGTIGIDYPIFNIPVVNASRNNPHINYNFNFHPKTINELKNIILNFKIHKKKIEIKKDEIYEYYSIRNIFFSKNWFFSDIEKSIKEIGNYHLLWREEFYNYWIKNFDQFDEKITIENIQNYFNSKNIFLLNNDNLGKF